MLCGMSIRNKTRYSVYLVHHSPALNEPRALNFQVTLTAVGLTLPLKRRPGKNNFHAAFFSYNFRDLFCFLKEKAL